MLKGVNIDLLLRSLISGIRVKYINSVILCLAASFFLCPNFISAKESTPEDLADLSLEELTEIEITSVSRRAEKLSEAASAIQVITAEDIRRSGATSIPEALRLATNLQVAQQNSLEWIISARGFSSDVGNKLLVLFDGRTIYTPLFSGVFWDRQNYVLEDIERIEVISGPGGTLWGGNAVNGVINIITKNAKATQGLYLEAGGGTELRKFASTRYGGTLAPNVNYRVYGKYFERDGSVFKNGDDNADIWDMEQAGFRIDADPTSQDVFTLQGDYYSNDVGIELDTNANTDGSNILGRWTHTFSSHSDMSLQFYYDRTRLYLPVPGFAIGGLPLAPAGILKDDLDTFDIDFQHSFQLGNRNHFIWGLNYRYTHDVVLNAPGLAFLPAHLDQELYSGFIQDEITLIPDKLKLTVGSKFEHNDYTGWEVVPSTRLQWDINEEHMLWAAISRAVRTPSRIDRDFSQPAPGVPPFFLVILAGGPDFDSENVIAYELGHRGQFGPKIVSSVSLFYNEYDDIRSTSLSPPDPVFGLPFPFFFENNLEGKTYGFELSVNYQALDWWRLTGGYNLLKGDIDVKPGRFDFNNALNETADPEHQFSLRSSMNLLQNVELDAGLRWVDTLHINNSGIPATVSSYTELDVRLGWKPIEELELSIVGQNLLHDHHPEFGVPGPVREEIGRSIYGKIAWRF